MNLTYDYVIVGAGPAGLQMGYYLEKAKKRYIILEKAPCAGDFFSKYPRQRTLISINKVHTGYDDPEINLRWDWNSLLCDEELLFKQFSKKYFPSADCMVDYLKAFADKFNLNVKYNVEINNTSKKNGIFSLKDQNDEVITCQYLLMATGVFKPYIPDIKGIENVTENYSNASKDPEDYAGDRVLILGKGNSGFEMANSMVDTASVIHLASRNNLNLAWKTHYVGHLRAINNNILDTYMLKSQNALISANIDRIEKTSDGKFKVTFSYNNVEEVEVLYYERVILATGFKFDDRIFDESCQPELCIDDRFPRQTSAWESTNISNLYFMGVLMHMRDFKKKQSGFIHGFRYNIKSLYHILEERNHELPVPYEECFMAPDDLTDLIINKVNKTSALWQQTGFMADAIVLDEDGVAQYYDAMPVDYLMERFAAQESYLIITLEFGQKFFDEASDIFSMDRVHKSDYENAHLSKFLHPIVREYSKGELIAEHHIIEDFESVWTEEVHVAPLKRFLGSILVQTELNYTDQVPVFDRKQALANRRVA